MIVDDSAVVRQVNRETLEREPDIEVIGVAADPLYALDKMKLQWPDVLVIDIEMPRMDGLTFLRKIMSERPTPTIVCSSLAEQRAGATIEALAAGALAIIAKPKLGVKQFLQDTGSDLVAAVRAAARANLSQLGGGAARPSAVSPGFGADAVRAAQAASARAMTTTTDRVVAIGTSTGGTQALEAVLSKLPNVGSGILIVQHMPERFTAMFAERLDSLCALEVREARNGDRIAPGRALIAPGGRH
ncbi:MAG: chemotaxis protein CheB, partial [Sulfuritalea sp.]|nr:chemotaxis protein CheB [Sulfuritalea sp.]